MSLYKQRFDDHAVHSLLSDADAQLASVSMTDLDAHAASIVLRVKRVLSHTREILQSADVEFTTAAMLESLGQAVTALRDQVANCKQSNQWDAMTKRGDGVIQHLAALPRHSDSASVDQEYAAALERYREFAHSKLEQDRQQANEHMAGIKDSLDELRAMQNELSNLLNEANQNSAGIQEALTRLQTTQASLDERIAAVQGNLAEVEGRCSAVLSETQHKAETLRQQHDADFKTWLVQQQSTYNDAQNSRATDFADKLSTWSTAFSQAENARQDEYTRAQNEKATEFAQAQSLRTTEFDESLRTWEQGCTTRNAEQQSTFEADSKKRLSDFTQTLEEASEKLRQMQLQEKEASTAAHTQEETKSNAHLRKLAEFESEAKNIVGIIGNVGVTGNYQKIADREHKAAENMRRLSLACFAIIVVVILYIVWQVHAENFNWEVGVFRVAIGLALLGPAYYCARESSRHRSNEERNRRIELELASLGPYLEKLTDDKAREVREDLARLYFGGESRGTSMGEIESLRGINLEDILKQLDRLAQWLKAFR